MRCKVCDSTYHFAKECPNRSAATLLQSSYDSHMKDTVVLDQEYESILLLQETRNKALIDTGATSTVCGESWLAEYVDSLSDDKLRRIKEKRGSNN